MEPSKKSTRVANESPILPEKQLTSQPRMPGPHFLQNEQGSLALQGKHICCPR